MEDGQNTQIGETLSMIQLASKEVLVQCQHPQLVWEGWDGASETVIANI
jgi:hypothetical protein